jgi:hypothetical protein
MEDLDAKEDLSYQKYIVKILETSEWVTWNKKIRMCKVQYSHHTEEVARMAWRGWVGPCMRGKLMRGRGSIKDSVRFREERGGRGSGRAWQHTGARVLGGGDVFLEEGEGEGAGVGQAGREAEAKEEWGGAGRPKAKAQAVGLKTGDGPKLKKKFLSNFKLNLGISLDFWYLHKEFYEEIWHEEFS